MKVEDSEAAPATISRTVRRSITFERHVLYVSYRKEEKSGIPEGQRNVKETRVRNGRYPMSDARVAV